MTQTEEMVPPTTEQQLEQFGSQVVELNVLLRAQQTQHEQIADLLAEVNLLARPAMDLAVRRLGQLDAAGYFAFAEQAAGIAETIVRAFSPEDVKALGDNIVTILQTVREMTQPEVMELVRRTAETAQEADEEFATPPSTFALMRQMRDPEVRRGIARVMAMLQTVGAEAHTPVAPAMPPAHA
jgi:uncharacterized protein YjgD (DUF1641 family)